MSTEVEIFTAKAAKESPDPFVPRYSRKLSLEDIK